jgi:hemerythrin-like domain-containing protein
VKGRYRTAEPFVDHREDEVIMGIQIGAKLDSGFDDPLGMLVDCHRRTEHFLGILCVVVERAQGGVLSNEERAAVHASLRYFRVGGKRHNADEEESVFARLRKDSSGDTHDELEHLEGDHHAAEVLHTQVESLYERWMQDGCLGAEQIQELSSSAKSLKDLYVEHIEFEERSVFPRAAVLLDKNAIATIGQEFRRRRE